ncbi:MAG TPA: ABC transporter permease [bacterium]|jgi:ABC-type dipeptide/oligopeptide/nickel transport system permease subunit|nr:ABC transporter permease [bacterium]
MAERAAALGRSRALLRVESPRTIAWRRFRRDALGLTGSALILMLVLVALLAPWVAPHDPMAIDLAAVLRPPSLAHWMGTDESGRDVFSRVLWGARVSLTIAVVIRLVTLAIGIAVGALAGFYEGWVDVVIMRGVEILLAFPGLLLLIGIASALGPGFLSLLIAFSVTGWTTTARLVRGKLLSIKREEYMEAARAIGVPARTQIVRHALPNAMGPVIVTGTIGVAGIILAEAGLSFLGLGIQPPTPTWGGMIAQGRSFLTVAWWASFFPGLAMAVAVFGFNLFGDALRDALDPRAVR